MEKNNVKSFPFLRGYGEPMEIPTHQASKKKVQVSLRSNDSNAFHNFVHLRAIVFSKPLKPNNISNQ